MIQPDRKLEHTQNGIKRLNLGLHRVILRQMPLAVSQSARTPAKDAAIIAAGLSGPRPGFASSPMYGAAKLCCEDRGSRTMKAVAAQPEGLIMTDDATVSLVGSVGGMAR